MLQRTWFIILIEVVCLVLATEAANRKGIDLVAVQYHKGETLNGWDQDADTANLQMFHTQRTTYDVSV